MKEAKEHITLEQFAKIKEVFDSKADTEDKIISVASIVTGKSVEEILTMPLDEAAPLFARVQNLRTPKKAKAKSKYKIGEWRLRLTDRKKMIVAQWIDFQSYARDMDKNMVEVLSVVLVPEGKSYNEGYDMEALQRDLRQMDVEDALGVCFFFRRRYLRLMKRILTYLIGWGMMMRQRKIWRRALSVRREIGRMESSL